MRPQYKVGARSPLFCTGLRSADPPFRHHYSRALQSSQKRQVNAGSAFVATHLLEALTKTVLHIDFTSVVMNGTVSILALRGSAPRRSATLVSRAVPAIQLATFATITSTFIVGFLFWQTAGLLG